MNRIQRLRARIQELLQRRDAERAELLALAELERDLTTEEEARWAELAPRFGADGTWAEADELARAEAELASLEAVANAPGSARETVGLTFVQPNTDDVFARGREHGAPSEVRSTALRVAERADGVPDGIRDALQGALRRLDGPTADGRLSRHVVAHMRPEYRSFLQKYMVGREASATPEERAAADQARAVNITTDSQGGYAVVPTYDLTLILTGDHDGLVAPQWRQLATNRQLTSGDTWYGLTSGGVTASWDGEFEEVSDDSPTFTQPSITVKKAQAFMEYSIEAEQDIAGLEGTARELFSVAKADLEAEAFSKTTAPTSKQPYGLIYRLDGTSSELAETTDETFTLPDVYKLLDGLPARFRGRATWMGEISTASKIRQFDTAGGAQIWAPTLQAGTPPTLLERPFVENPSMPGWSGINALATADNFILLFGDFSAYYIVDRVGTTVEFVPHLFDTAHNRPKGSRGLFMYWRVGADVVDSNRFRVLNVTTAA